ncbi:hypothetical protein CPB86DRAFT_738719 [Serendipita vermifera]|nr:hypothetical protein CPB86DRAFT_738719 [Serendipita vermifera]
MLDGLFSFPSSHSSMKAVKGVVKGAAQYVPDFLKRKKEAKAPVAASSDGIVPNEASIDEEASTLFALIIGIDRYLNPKEQLEGAVNDAKEMEKYVRETFPSSQICTLHDEKATRASIIQEIRSLGTKSEIRLQDPILIFYAGHGGEAPPPANWGVNGQKVQMLIPQDHRDGQNVITDVAFARLLEELASAKGDNIVVILDCCHSGGLNRGVQSDGVTRRTRAIQFVNPLPDDVDKDIFERKGAGSTLLRRPFQNSDVTSHVLLAACGEHELAVEEGGIGVFTREFLKTIRRLGYKNMTYAEVIRRLSPLQNQSPRCDGKNRDRCFFDPKPPGYDRSWRKVEVQGDKFVVHAGEAHGVNTSTTFALFKSRDQDIPPIGNVTVLKVTMNQSTLDMSSLKGKPLPNVIYAVQTKFIPVCFVQKPGLDKLRKTLEKDMVSSASQLHRYSFVTKENASIEVDIDKDFVVFNNVNEDFQKKGYSRMPFRVKSGEVGIIRSVIKAASDFSRYLALAPQNGVLHNFVEVEFVKISRPLDRQFGPVAQSPDAKNLCQNGLVEITAGDTLYGIKITNNSPLALYPHLFLFDCSDLSIESYYTPPVVSDEDHEAPLPPKGTFTIGYGRVGETPWSHYVRDEEEVYQNGKVLQDEQDIDVCVFKLFLTAKPTDLSSIAQPSPFTGDAREVRRFKWSKEEWDTISIIVVVRK